jgi:Outer membrane protein beta-barrel domain
MMMRSVRAQPDEQRRTLPGDELMADAQSLTHAVTIERPRSDVWPWLVQMGSGRAGWYSYDRIDNGGAASLDRIDPELQELALGDVFPAMPGVSEGFVVLGFHAGHYLILGWPSSAGQPPTTTWAFVLESPTPGRTRLIVRARADERYRPPFGLPRWTTKTLVPLGHAIMQRKQLLGIARRAEAAPVGKAVPNEPEVVMSHRLFGALTVLLITTGGTAEGQSPWRFEVAGGAAFATQELGNSSLGTGFGFEGTVGYRVQPHLWVYAGWDWHRFTSDESAAADGDFDETGYAFGLQFEHPLRGLEAVALRLRAGGTYNHIEAENAAGDLVGDSDHGLGWEAGAGLAFQLNDRWQVTPGARFRSLSRDFTLGGLPTSADLRYVAVEVGFSRRF